ncbi:uncharacterized protein KY384_001485 [Bacidia gigantensis]|uniref:uncharacterized protein n=1 Tax=Bacidia gigantensis TaxID=2732470 RepID=UPI001D05213D|nr:uncharacterized protein KY384_001485 [Bacidia gigantensis]KAG8533744.1 hypothetical protein KY384_001485 [Bacidia gigantensis]
MPWRFSGLANRYGRAQRPYASLQGTRLGNTQDAGLILPGSPSVDASSRLVGESSARTKDSHKTATVRVGATEIHQGSDGTVGRKGARAAKLQGQDESNKATYPHLATQTTDEATEPASRCEELKIHYHVSQHTKIGWRSKFRTYQSPVPVNEDEAIYKDLNNLVNTYRATQLYLDSVAITPSPIAAPASSPRSNDMAGFKPQRGQHMALNKRPVLHASLPTKNQPFRKVKKASISTQRANPQAHVISVSDDPSGPRPDFMYDNSALEEGIGGVNIREHLMLWQAHQNSLDEHAPTHRESIRISLSDALDGTRKSDEEDLLSPLVPTEIEEDEAYANLDQEDAAFRIMNAPRSLKQGDLAALRVSSGSLLAIFIKPMEDTSLFYTQRGSWIFASVGQCDFVITQFLNPCTLSDILASAPDDPNSMTDSERVLSMSRHAPRGAGRNALEAMQSFERLSDTLYRKHADKLNRAYHLLAPDAYAEGFKTLSLIEIAKELFEIDNVSGLTQVMLWTTHRTLTRLENVFKSSKRHRENPHFTFIPKQNLEQLRLTQEWMRDFQERYVEAATTSKETSPPTTYVSHSGNPIASFVIKARNWILLSRQKRPVSPTGGVGPTPDRSDQKSDQPRCSISEVASLSREDKTILHYIDAWVAAKSIRRYGSFEALGPMILRAVGLYEHLDLDQSTGYTFLQELGIIAPWQNPSLHQLRSGLPGYNPLHTISRLREEARQQLPNLHLKDSMESFRKDWGEIPIFCIDGEETVERDDGISIESISGKPSQSWIHIHVANPSAFISPDSSIARYAAEISQSIYLPEEKHAMLDPGISQKYFSLARDRPCITFSARLNDNGDVIESLVTHGIARNVQFFTHERVRAELSLGEETEQGNSAVWTVGGNAHDVSSKAELDRSQLSHPFPIETVAKLRRILELGEAVKRRRERNGALSFENTWGLSNSMPKVSFGPRSSLPSGLSSQVRHFDGDPAILIEQNMANNADKLVSNIMVLAGEICARWCSSRRIPIPYRGMRIDPDPQMPPDEFRQNVLVPSIYKGNEIAYNHNVRQYVRLLGYTDMSASPLEHPMLGLPSYAMATSPLRRYNDLVVHWQIEAALRREKVTGTAVDEKNDSTFLPFSYNQVETLTKRLWQRQREAGDAQFSSFLHWNTLALFRAFYFKEAPLPKTFRVAVQPLSTVRKAVFANITAGGARVVLRDSSPVVKAHDGYRTADVWEAKIDHINVYHKRISMEPIRLVSRLEP